MKVLKIGFSCAALIVLAACNSLGADGKRIDYGAEARQVPSLEVPPDLTVPGSDDRFRIPQADGSASATYSDYNKGDSGIESEKVLPVMQWIRLERDGAQRWLTVRDTPDNVWPVVKAFWVENGLKIRNEEPAAGVIETDWAENRALLSGSAETAKITSAFDSASTAGTRDQYVTRLERGKDGMTTEIYITHRGIVEVLSMNGSTISWKARPQNPELEAIMLQRLMLRFGAGEAQAAIALEKANAAPTQPPVSEPETSAEPAGTSSLRKIGDDTVIVINDPFDRSWRQAGLAIEATNLAVEDKDREKGIYYLGPIIIQRGFWASLKFWQSNEDTDRQYRVNVKDGGTTCEVTITDQNGTTNKASKQMLEAIYKNINQP